MTKRQKVVSTIYIAFIVAIFAAIGTGKLVYGSSDRDDEQNDVDYVAIDLLYQWNYRLSDGELTYSIESDDKLFNAMIDIAMQEWEDKLADVITFKKVDNQQFNFGGADIKFDRVDDIECADEEGKDWCYKHGSTPDFEGGDVVGGRTLIKHHGNIMTGATVQISDAIIQAVVDNNKDGDVTKHQILETIKDVIKHEIGHTLGLGHANSPDSLMYQKTDSGQRNPEVTSCEAYHVFITNGFLDAEAVLEDEMSDEYPDEVQTVEDAVEKLCSLDRN